MLDPTTSAQIARVCISISAFSLALSFVFFLIAGPFLYLCGWFSTGGLPR